MAEHDLHEFVGPVIAQIVFEVPVASHVERFAVVDGRHHVPGRASVRHQVERGEPTRHVEGLVVRRRARRSETQPRRRHAHDRQHDDRVHFHAADAVFDRVRMVVAIAIGHGQAVIEERHVQLARFQDAADLLVVVVRHGIVARLWVAPGTGKIGAILRLQEPDHHHLSRHAITSLVSTSLVSTWVDCIGSSQFEFGGQVEGLGERTQLLPGRAFDVDAGLAPLLLT
jgi:hypothetical protein